MNAGAVEAIVIQRAALGVAELIARRKAAEPYVQSVTDDELLARGQRWIARRIEHLLERESFYAVTNNPRRDLTGRQLARLFRVAQATQALAS